MNSKLFTMLIVGFFSTAALADLGSTVQPHSQYGDIAACDLFNYFSSEGYNRDCSTRENENVERSRIVFNGKVIWSDSSRPLRFAEKYILLNDHSEEIEVFVFYTSTGGSGCPMELTVVVVAKDGINVEGAFGNCMDVDGIRIEPVEKGVHFLFECGNAASCKTKQTGYAYHCFISNDINQKMACSGNRFCSRYSEITDNRLFYWNDGRQTVEVEHHCGMKLE